ncbi:Crp/Fnr family transcriptional regulator [Halomonas shantousis]
MLTNFIQKLNNFQEHSADEIAILEDAVSGVVDVDKGIDILNERQRPGDVQLLIDGWACRYSVTRQGKGQIMAYLLPGDLCDVHVTLLNRMMDHSIRTLSRAKVASIPRRKMEDIIDNHPRLARSLFWSTLVDESILRMWLLNLGARPANRRLAHLFCELLVRSRAAGLTANHSFYLPLTQAELGEAMGITIVHTNRVMQKLRSEGLITFRQKHLQINDWEAFKSFSEFESTYLHLERADPSLARDL